MFCKPDTVIEIQYCDIGSLSIDIPTFPRLSRGVGRGEQVPFSLLLALAMAKVYLNCFRVGTGVLHGGAGRGKTEGYLGNGKRSRNFFSHVLQSALNLPLH